MIEDELHLFYQCDNVKNIWKKVSNILKTKVKEKDVILVSIRKCSDEKRMKYEMIAIVKYSIYITNNRSKCNKHEYKEKGITKRIIWFLDNVEKKKKRILQTKEVWINGA